MWFLHNPGILGINARNLLYIKAYNPNKAVLFADSKIKTKHFLSARGVPVAKLYATISTKKELRQFNWMSLPSSFVVKPNSGYGGEGILVIKEKDEKEWIKSDGEKISHKRMIGHINDILDCRYSISGMPDIAIFEQRLVAPEPFSDMAYNGLPDIRIIVHNLIPVMAMLRLPTRESQGKANVHLGGIAAGIDIAKGEITYVTQYNRQIPEVPGYGKITGIKIPDWEKILLIASRVQQISNLGFAAIDLTLDKTMGPTLLEINARAGLSVQIANMAPLRRRLGRIEGIKVQSPEKGVRIAQDMFGQKFEKSSAKKIIIGPVEEIEIISEKGTKQIPAIVDLSIKKSKIDSGLAVELGISAKGVCKITIAGQRLALSADVSDMRGEPYLFRLGSSDIKDFIIDPSKKFGESKDKIVNVKFSINDVKTIDKKIVEVDKQIHLLSYVKPLNLAEEEEKVLENPDYNPQFEYKSLAFDPNALLKQLDTLSFPDSPIGILLEKKSDEIRRKIAVLKSIGTDEFTEKSFKLYGKPDVQLLNRADRVIKQMPASFPEENVVMDAVAAAKKLEEFLHIYGLGGWRVSLKKDLVSDIVAGKENTIFMRTYAKFSEQRFKNIIAHEIETHVFTAINGKNQPYMIFQRGLGDYLCTEEGLAVYNQEMISKEKTQKKYWPAASVIGVSIALKGSFVDIVRTLNSLGFDIDRSIRTAFKIKRGLKDTEKPGAFTREIVYFKGHEMIKSFVKKGGDLKDLYLGKINLKDLPLVKKVEGLRQPKYLPGYLLSL